MNLQQKVASGLSALAANVEQGKYGQDDDLDLDALQEDIDEILSDVEEEDDGS